jgi:7-cyano-7-deazaguanine synthase
VTASRISRSSPAAVVLLSGGLDSAVTLALAREAGFEPAAITFDYGQRHRFELAAARRVARSIGVSRHALVNVDLRAIGGSALTDDAIDVPKEPLESVHEPSPHGRGQGKGSSSSRETRPHPIPVTYVPARNTVFLSLALSFAESIGSTDLFIGANAVDYSGYPDCRPDFIRAFEHVANLGTKAGDEGARFTVHAPLIEMSKAAIIRRGVELGVDLSLTHSCYDPDPATGAACGSCDSCTLRRRGFEHAGVPDPTRYASAGARA